MSPSKPAHVYCSWGDILENNPTGQTGVALSVISRGSPVVPVRHLSDPGISFIFVRGDGNSREDDTLSGDGRGDDDESAITWEALFQLLTQVVGEQHLGTVKRIFNRHIQNGHQSLGEQFTIPYISYGSLKKHSPSNAPKYPGTLMDKDKRCMTLRT